MKKIILFISIICLLFSVVEIQKNYLMYKHVFSDNESIIEDKDLEKIKNILNNIIITEDYIEKKIDKENHRLYFLNAENYYILMEDSIEEYYSSNRKIEYKEILKLLKKYNKKDIVITYNNQVLEIKKNKKNISLILSDKIYNQYIKEKYKNIFKQKFNYNVLLYTEYNYYIDYKNYFKNKNFYYLDDKGYFIFKKKTKEGLNNYKGIHNINNKILEGNKKDFLKNLLVFYIFFSSSIYILIFYLKK